jgi:hypothetical protein
MNAKPLPRGFRILSYGMAAVFAAVGLLFLLMPGRVVGFFNALSGPLGMAAAPVPGPSLFTGLAVAYMVIVTRLAWGMARDPWNGAYSGILVQAKFASAFLSAGLFLVHGPFLIYLANGSVDGLIGIGVILLRSRLRGYGRR